MSSKIDSEFLITVDAFSLAIHDSITKDALPFLKPEKIREINGGHWAADYTHQTNSAQHFDNCNFEEGSMLINKLYNQIIKKKPFEPNEESNSG